MTSLIEGAGDLSGYPTVFDPNTLHRKGLCPVTTLAHKHAATTTSSSVSSVLPASHSLYFEVWITLTSIHALLLTRIPQIHGDGPQKVVLIMGLNASSFGWSLLVEHLTTIKEADGSYRYSVLVFDNRGVGNSGTPKGPYSTSGMAQDVIILLDYIGWTAPRQLHVVGISMGGMIALEFASRVASRIVSLSLIVTTAGGLGFSTFTPLKGVVGLARLVFTKKAEDKVQILLPLLYPITVLSKPAEQYDQPDITLHQYLTPRLAERLTITRPQTLMGSLSQMYAALMHNVSTDRLATISKSIPKVYIMTGDEDNLVKPINSHWLRDHMKEAEFELWDETGHGVLGQHPKRSVKTIQRIFDEGVERAKSFPS